VTLLGRRSELDTIARFLDLSAAGPPVLVVEGESGIGKSVLFDEAVAQSVERNFQCLIARPTRSESKLAFVGLADLLVDQHGLLRALPLPQRAALEAALLLRAPTEVPPEPRAIGTAFLTLIQEAIRTGPVLVAIDDAQWLDSASASAVGFAARRLQTGTVRFLTSARREEGTLPAWVGELVGDRLSVGPLSVGAIHALLSARFDLTLPRSVLVRVHEASHGNPLIALELGRALSERGMPEPGRPFDLPDDIDELLHARLVRMPAATSDVLALVAGAASPTLELLAMAGIDDPPVSLQPAVAADIVSSDGGRVRFTHPLLESAVYRHLGAAQRRAVHRRLAEATTDAEQRARHLALAAEGPDSAVADALDQAAELAENRGALSAAADLTDLALQLSPPNDSQIVERRLQAARRHFAAGDVPRSRALAQELVDTLPAGVERARALIVLAEAWSGFHDKMKPLRERAVVEAADDDRVLAPALRNLAQFDFVTGNPALALNLAQQSVAAADRTGDPRHIVPSLSWLAFLEVWKGSVTPGLLDRAFELQPRAGYLRIYQNPLTVEGVRLTQLTDDLEGALATLSQADATFRDHGDEEARGVVLAHIVEVEIRRGELERAAGLASEAHEIRQQFGLGTGASLYWVALTAALLGEVDAAREAAEEGSRECRRVGYKLFEIRNQRVLGFLAVSQGDFARAASILEPLPGSLADLGYGDVNLLQVLPDAMEALVGAGKLQAAQDQLDRLEEIARTLGIASAQFRAARARGLLAAAKRDYWAAAAAFDEALVAHERMPDPLERGRTLLAMGQTQRRAGERAKARESLSHARAIFDELGTPLWAAQAQAELSRVGGRTATGAARLTGAEEQVAQLVAAGHTNREVAAALFVTERTVETHLTSIYRKLDLRSRTELAHRMRDRT
jgi:DNA-binding CsgD family transcriptional regulator